MLGISVFLLLVFLEIGFLLLSLIKKVKLLKEKYIVRIILAVIFTFLLLVGAISWNFRWVLLEAFLVVQAIITVIKLIIMRNKTYDNVLSSKTKTVLVFIGRGLVIFIIMLPIFIFPESKGIEPTGDYDIDTVSYTLTDQSRDEYFTEDSTDKRNVTIQFWYPSKKSEKYPLVIFSHGAFGYRGSNGSTFKELASHGYVVCSIDHTYHSFLTKQTDGKTILGNKEFMATAMNPLDDEEMYKWSHKALQLRTDDMSFVLNYIKDMTKKSQAEPVFKKVDLEHIGVMGHSMGGACAAEIGRENNNVDAVIVIDGTMIGEEIGYKNNKSIIRNDPYPKPILNFYNQSHFNDAMEAKDEYENMIMQKNSPNAYQVVIKGSGHMNFTDLPLFSPFLANLLETGDVNVDARYCINTTNKVILQFFDCYLKDQAKFTAAGEY